MMSSNGSLTNEQQVNISHLAQQELRKILQQVFTNTGYSQLEGERIIQNLKSGTFGDILIQPLRTALDSACMGNPELYKLAVVSEFRYNPEYRVEPIEGQIYKLKQIFPVLGGFNTAIYDSIMEGKRAVDVDMEEFFVYPHWSRIAPSYIEAVKKLLDVLLDVIPGGIHDRLTEYGGILIAETPHKMFCVYKTLIKQDADLLILPAQFGVQQRGRDIQSTEDLIHRKEFMLGIYEVLIMLISHPNIIANPDDIRLLIGGDIVKPHENTSQINSYGFQLSFSPVNRIEMTLASRTLCDARNGIPTARLLA